MLQEFLRLAVYVPVDEASQGPGLDVVSAPAVREILRTFREFDFVGSVGTYKAVAEISSGAETLCRLRILHLSTARPTSPQLFHPHGW
jgi:hypothetical protein